MNEEELLDWINEPPFSEWDLNDKQRAIVAFKQVKEMSSTENAKILVDNLKRLIDSADDTA